MATVRGYNSYCHIAILYATHIFRCFHNKQSAPTLMSFPVYFTMARRFLANAVWKIAPPTTPFQWEL